MKYLVLGSNSFAGSCFVDYLLTQEHQVIGISRSPEPSAVLLTHAKNPNHSSFTFHQFDINQHLNEIKTIVNTFKPQYIVDFAGQGMVAESWQQPEQWYETNIMSKVKLHDFLRTCDFLERYVRISTPEVYGDMPPNATEEQSYNPSTPYAVSHAATDMSLMAFHRQYDFPVSVARFANFYGPHQQLYRIIPRTIIYSLIGKKLQLHGGGKSERAFIYGADVASGIDAVIHKGKIGEVYHFSSEQPVSIANLVREIASTVGVDFDSLVEVSEDRPGKDALYSMSIDKAVTELNWKPTTSLAYGIDKTVSWVKENIESIKNYPLEYVHKP